MFQWKFLPSFFKKTYPIPAPNTPAMFFNHVCILGCPARVKDAAAFLHDSASQLTFRACYGRAPSRRSVGSPARGSRTLCSFRRRGFCRMVKWVRWGRGRRKGQSSLEMIFEVIRVIESSPTPWEGARERPFALRAMGTR